MNWFKDEAEKLRNDPGYIGEVKLMDLTEHIWKMGRPSGIYMVLYRVLEFCAGKLIWRKP
uniref:Uncharacterized protein n=1 Tax=viral metagenome TaxID=1070528 RepID=A0A6H1ZM02_9ZZZZ